MSDDVIVGAGLEALGQRAGITVTAISAEELPRQRADRWELTLLWPADGRVDTFKCVEDLPAYLGCDSAAGPVACVVRSRSSDLLRLRLAEAGVTHVISRRRLNEILATGSDQFGQALEELRPLPEPAVLRRRMELHAAGQLGPLLLAARDVPPVVWTTRLSQADLPLTRGQVTKLRRIAGQQAGIPPTEFIKHASSVRAAPLLPDWNTVRRTVRAAMGIADE